MKSGQWVSQAPQVVQAVKDENHQAERHRDQGRRVVFRQRVDRQQPADMQADADGVGDLRRVVVHQAVVGRFRGVQIDCDRRTQAHNQDDQRKHV